MLAPILALIQVAYVSGDQWLGCNKEEAFTSAINSKIEELTVEASQNNQTVEIKDIKIMYKLEERGCPRAWIIYELVDDPKFEK